MIRGLCWALVALAPACTLTVDPDGRPPLHHHPQHQLVSISTQAQGKPGRGRHLGVGERDEARTNALLKKVHASEQQENTRYRSMWTRLDRQIEKSRQRKILSEHPSNGADQNAAHDLLPAPHRVAPSHPALHYVDPLTGEVFAKGDRVSEHKPDTTDETRTTEETVSDTPDSQEDNVHEDDGDGDGDGDGQDSHGEPATDAAPKGTVDMPRPQARLARVVSRNVVDTHTATAAGGERAKSTEQEPPRATGSETSSSTPVHPREQNLPVKTRRVVAQPEKTEEAPKAQIGAVPHVPDVPPTAAAAPQATSAERTADPRAETGHDNHVASKSVASAHHDAHPAHHGSHENEVVPKPQLVAGAASGSGSTRTANTATATATVTVPGPDAVLPDTEPPAINTKAAHPASTPRHSITADRSATDVWPIDLVYLWVDGRDASLAEALQALKKDRRLRPHAYRGIEWTADSMLDDRWREHEELRYSLRSVQQNAPWVNNIFIVSGGQGAHMTPKWLKYHPKVIVVPHKAIYPQNAVLPTFNSLAIECVMDQIPDLSERFIYMNDDMMFGAEVKPSDFFDETGRPIVHLADGKDTRNWMAKSRVGISTGYRYAVHNVDRMLDQQFHRERRRLMIHQACALTKSLFARTRTLFPKPFEDFARHRLRDKKDIIAQTLVQWVGLYENAAVVNQGTISNRLIQMTNNQRDNENQWSRFFAKPSKLLCVGDMAGNSKTWSSGKTGTMSKVLQKQYQVNFNLLYPEPSDFETDEGSIQNQGDL